MRTYLVMTILILLPVTFFVARYWVHTEQGQPDVETDSSADARPGAIVSKDLTSEARDDPAEEGIADWKEGRLVMNQGRSVSRHVPRGKVGEVSFQFAEPDSSETPTIGIDLKYPLNEELDDHNHVVVEITPPTSASSGIIRLTMMRKAGLIGFPGQPQERVLREFDVPPGTAGRPWRVAISNGLMRVFQDSEQVAIAYASNVSEMGIATVTLNAKKGKLALETLSCQTSSPPFVPDISNEEMQDVWNDTFGSFSSGIRLASEGRYHDAIPTLQHALSLARRFAEENPATVQLQSSIADLLQKIDEVALAREYLEAALASQEASLDPEHPNIALTLIRIGSAANALGDTAEAIEYTRRGVEINERVFSENDQSTAHAVKTLARLQLRVREYEAAERGFRRSIRILTHLLGSNHYALADPMSALAITYAAQGKREEALTLAEQAMQLIVNANGPEHSSTQFPLRALGDVQSLSGQTSIAIQTFQRLLANMSNDDGSYRRNEAVVRLRLAYLYQLQKEHADSDKQLRIAQDLMLSLAGEVIDSLPEVQAISFLREVSILRDMTLPMLRNRKARNAQRAYDVLWKTRGITAASLAARRDLATQTEDGRELWQQLRGVRGRLSQAFLASVQDPASSHPTIVELTKQKESLERELAAVNQAFRERQEVGEAEVANLLKALPKDVAVVELIRTRQHPANPMDPNDVPSNVYDAFVLRNDLIDGVTPITWVPLGDALAIEAAIDRWRQRISTAPDLPSRGDASDGSPQQQLGDLVWTKLEPHLADCSTVLIIPDQATTRIPWAALPGRAPETFLLEDYGISVVPTAQQVLRLLQSDSVEQPAQVLLVGGIDYDARSPAQDDASTSPKGEFAKSNRSFLLNRPEVTALPGTLEEVRRIADLRGKDPAMTILTGADPTEDTVREKLPQARFIHLATHGFFSGGANSSAIQPSANEKNQQIISSELSQRRNPMLLSGLVLAGANQSPKSVEEIDFSRDDQIMTAEEIQGLNLAQTELVVLSACETGLGELSQGEGVFGLQRAFAVAGARSVVASLWNVDDQATSAFMVEFYRQLWKSDQPTSKMAALRRAQIQMIKRYDAAQSMMRGVVRPAQPKSGDDPQNSTQKTLPPYYWAGFVLSGDWR